MAEEITFPEPFTWQGISQTYQGTMEKLERVRTNQYTYNHGGFLLKDGRYCYRDYIWTEGVKFEFYHVLSSKEKGSFDFLDYWNKLEERQNRHSIDSGSYKYQNYLGSITDENDEDNVSLNPIDTHELEEWCRDEDASEGKRFPIKPENAIIHAFIQQLTPADRLVYESLFNGDMADAEVKEEDGQEHSTWSMKKRRFLDKVREAFIANGYDVPTAEELRKEKKAYADRLREAAEERAEEEKTARWGQSIAREQVMMEQSRRLAVAVKNDARIQESIEQMLDEDIEDRWTKLSTQKM